MAKPPAVPIEISEHPTLRAAAFSARYPARLGELTTPQQVIDLLSTDSLAPVQRTEALRTAIRDLLRWGGYRPTGRGKPASEYLVRSAQAGSLAPINLAADVCNAVSLHSGLPISVVDLDLARPPFRIAIADRGSSYVFNAGGQEIDLSGLVCLFDADGPCANAVRDAQRTKTSASTTDSLSVVWGCAGHEEHVEMTVAWYRSLLVEIGAAIQDS
jgi:DNA/RNA-binding domain of Phe-tRNA-synthetase-like protein